MSSALDRKAKQILEFYTEAKDTKLIEKTNPVFQAQLNAFAIAYDAFVTPDQAMRNYRLALVPYLATYARTRVLLKSTIALLEAWSAAAGNASTVLASTGAWLVGADPDGDLEQLEQLHAAFVRNFGAAGLPPALKVEAVKQHVAAHHKADHDKPAMPIGRKRSEVEAEQRKLDAEATDLFRQYHDFLDSWFGKSGDAAFVAKKRFAYDRRTISSKRSGKRDETDGEPVAPGAIAAGTAGAVALSESPATPIAPAAPEAQHSAKLPN